MKVNQYYRVIALIGEYCPELVYTEGASVGIPTRDNINQYQCNNLFII